MNVLQNQRNHISKHLKKRLNQDQVGLLEASFDPTKKLEPGLKLHLARQLGLPPRQIAIWYQNKRARCKNQTLELKHTSLQLRLDSALADKRRLQHEAEILRVELKRARDFLFGLNWTSAQTQAHLVCDDVATGEGVLPFEEVCGCLMVQGSYCAPTPKF